MPANTTPTTPTTPATAEAVEPQKIEFTPEQRAYLEDLLKQTSATAASEALAEVERLKAQIKAQTVTPSPDLSRDLELSRAELAALKSEQAEARIGEQLRQAAGDTFLSSLGVRLMRDSVKIGAKGEPVVVDENGQPRLGATLAPMTLAELAQSVAEQHKYLARGVVKPGAGSVPSQGATARPDLTLTQLFGRGPGATPGAAHRLALTNITEYRRLHKLAQERGIC